MTTLPGPFLEVAPSLFGRRSNSAAVGDVVGGLVLLGVTNEVVADTAVARGPPRAAPQHSAPLVWRPATPADTMRLWRAGGWKEKIIIELSSLRHPGEAFNNTHNLD